MLQAAALLELLTVTAPAHFLALGSAANALKGLAWMAAGSTRSVFHVSFARDSNIADVTAKGAAARGAARRWQACGESPLPLPSLAAREAPSECISERARLPVTLRPSLAAQARRSTSWPACWARGWAQGCARVWAAARARRRWPSRRLAPWPCCPRTEPCRRVVRLAACWGLMGPLRPPLAAPPPC